MCSSGSAIAKKFNKHFDVAIVDHAAPKSPSSLFIQLGKQGLEENFKPVEDSLLKGFLREDKSIYGFICVAGGFEMHSLLSPELFKSYDAMLNKNLSPCLLAARLAAKYAEKNGFFVMTGAATIFEEPRPAMLTYSLAKNAVHSLNLMLAKDPVFVEKGIRNFAILPTTIDTPANRDSMPTADHSEWIAPEDIANFLLMKAEEDSPTTPGAFVKLSSKKGQFAIDYV